MSHRGGRGRYNRPSYNNQTRVGHQQQNNYAQPAYTTQSVYSTPQVKNFREDHSATTPTHQPSPVQQQQQQQLPATPQQPPMQQQQQQQQQQPPPPPPPPQQQQQNQQQSTIVPSPQQETLKPIATPHQQQQQMATVQQKVDKFLLDSQSQFANNQPAGNADNKNQSTTPGLAESGNNDDDSVMDLDTSGEIRRKYKPWIKRGTLGIRISRKIKKRRQNARLRNILAPKNAMMVLHELHPELKMTISEQPNAANQMGYTVEIEIDGKVYRGHGMSKICAKQAGSENALKAVLLEKLEQNNVKLNAESVKSETSWEDDAEMTVDSSSASAATPANTNAAEVDTNAAAVGIGGGGDAANKDSSTDGSPNKGLGPGGRQIQEDDVPWGSLASFALYKLFSEWQSQGFQLPASSGLPAVFQRAGVPLPYPKKILPEDASKKHPVQLLNQIRPGCQYIESREGMPPNLSFSFTVVVDGQTFTGAGTNKKDAKKECAKHALEAMGVKYD